MNSGQRRPRELTIPFVSQIYLKLKELKLCCPPSLLYGTSECPASARVRVSCCSPSCQGLSTQPVGCPCRTVGLQGPDVRITHLLQSVTTRGGEGRLLRSWSTNFRYTLKRNTVAELALWLINRASTRACVRARVCVRACVCAFVCVIARNGHLQTGKTLLTNSCEKLLIVFFGVATGKTSGDCGRGQPRPSCAVVRFFFLLKLRKKLSSLWVCLVKGNEQQARN